MRFARWMSKGWGRGPRIALGLALIAFGLYLQNPWGILLAVVGVFPVASGLDNFCVAAPIFGGRVDGRPLVK